jgi:hypothetical protein
MMAGYLVQIRLFRLRAQAKQAVQYVMILWLSMGPLTVAVVGCTV